MRVHCINSQLLYQPDELFEPYLFFFFRPLIFFGSRRLRVEWHWKVDFTKKVWTWTEVVKRQLLIFCTSTFISSYYWRQWRCRDDPFSCWFIFGLTWRSACHGVKNYFSQEIISPLLLLLTYTLLLFTAELQSNTNTTWYYQAGTVEVWYTWYTVSHSHLVESGTLGTLSIHYTVVHPVVHLVLLVHQVVHLVHLVQSGEWEWQIRDLTAAAAPWDLWGIAPPAFIFQMTILKLNFLSMVFFVQN